MRLLEEDRKDSKERQLNLKKKKEKKKKIEKIIIKRKERQAHH